MIMTFTVGDHDCDHVHNTSGGGGGCRGCDNEISRSHKCASGGGQTGSQPASMLTTPKVGGGGGLFFIDVDEVDEVNEVDVDGVEKNDGMMMGMKRNEEDVVVCRYRSVSVRSSLQAGSTGLVGVGNIWERCRNFVVRGVQCDIACEVVIVDVLCCASMTRWAVRPAL